MSEPGATMVPQIGPYRVTRVLEPSRHGVRALTLHTAHNTSHLLHEPRLTARKDRHSFAAAMNKLAALDHPHLLRAEAYGWPPPLPSITGEATGEFGGPWVMTDYTGDTDGIVTLDRLLRAKGGWLTLEESRRAMEQLLGACAYAHDLGLSHGTMMMDEVHVDRRGSLLVEFYGLRQALKPMPREAAEQEEVRSVVRIGYQLVTGLLPKSPLIPVEHVIEDIDRSWRAFFETGLGHTGFTSSAHALSAAKSCRIAGDGAIGSVRSLVRTVIGWK